MTLTITTSELPFDDDVHGPDVMSERSGLLVEVYPSTPTTRYVLHYLAALSNSSSISVVMSSPGHISCIVSRKKVAGFLYGSGCRSLKSTVVKERLPS